jgi:DNA-binding XRE family transcriptional regulator
MSSVGCVDVENRYSDSYNDISMEIGGRENRMKLSEARARKLFAVGKLAEAVGISRGHLYGIEGGRWLPSLETVRKICEVLEIQDPMEIDEFKAAIEKSIRGKEPARG